MNAISQGLLGVLCFVISGFVRGGLRSSPDPELVYAGTFGFAAVGLVLVIAAGVRLGSGPTRR